MTPDIAVQFEAIMGFLLTPWGILAMLAVPMLVMGLIASDRLKWIFIALLLWVSTFGLFVKTPWFNSTLISPLQQLRGMAKGFCIVMLLMMAPAALFSSATWRKKRVGAAVAMFFVFELVITTRQMGTGALLRSVLQLLLFTLLFLVLGIGLGNWLRQLDDVRKVLKAVSWAVMLLVCGSLLQVVIDSNQVVQNHRLFGTTNNPQFLGSMLGMSITPVLYLLLTNLEKPLWRATLAVYIGFMMVCLIWTGSRTGLLMAAVNVLLFLRLKLGRIVAAVTVACASFYVAMSLFPSSVAIVDRLFSSADTRSASFNYMIRSFLSHPFLGSIGEGFGFQENAYLAVAAQFGLLGLVPMIVAMIAIGTMLRKLQQIRPYLGQHAGMADVVIGVTCSLGIGSCFDAYPLAAIGFHVFLLYITLTVGEFLLDYVAATQQAQGVDVVVSPDASASVVPQAA
jgi:hypothetical protein